MVRQRQGTGGGEGLGKEMELRGPHTIHPAQSSSSLLPGEEAAVSCETTLSGFSRERMAKVNPRGLFVTISA